MNKFMELWNVLVVTKKLKSCTQKPNKIAILLQYHIMVNVPTVEPHLEKKCGIIGLIGIGLENKKQKKFLTNSPNYDIILTESEVIQMLFYYKFTSGTPYCGTEGEHYVKSSGALSIVCEGK